MNNGQPPYGDPSAWGQQNGQANPAQYPVQPNPYAQQGYGQQPYQQNMQGYAQPMQPVQPVPPVPPYQQQAPQAGYQQPQTYQQQAHPQQQLYQQQSWQPYQQPAQQTYNQQAYQQPQQFYGQQPNGGQAAYPQFNQMGQQVQQGYGTGYSGYYSQPQEKKFEVPFDVVGKVILFGVLPVLFVLAMVLGAAALKWVFLAGAVAGIILMWMRDIVSPNMRLTMSMVLGVMAVVALVGAMSGAPQDKQNNNTTNANQINQQQTGNVNVSQATTVVPAEQPTATPAPQETIDGAKEQLMSFFYYWSIGNDEAMISLTAPSWRASVSDPQKALFTLLLNRTPQDDYEITMSGTDNDALRTATVKVTIDKNDGRATKDRYAFKVIMKKEDGYWYVDPQSLESNEKETATETAATANNTPTQPPLYTGRPDTILYYNANGGSRYHLDPDCSEVGDRYKPMSQFLFAELNQSPYSELVPCGPCGAPIPDDE